MRHPGVAQVVEVLDAGAIHHILHQLGGQDQTLRIVALNLHQCVVEIGMHGDGAVGRQGPRVVVQITAESAPLPVWPSAQSNLAATAASSTALKRTSMEGSSCRSTPLPLQPARSRNRYPVHRLGAFVQVAVFNDLGHGADDVGFGPKIHGQVGCSQSPSTPRRMKSVFCASIWVLAYLRHSARNSAAETFSPGLPTMPSTFSSMGRPWQSQPGT